MKLVEAQVSVLLRWRTDTDQRNVAVLDRLGGVRRSGKLTRGHRLANDLIEPGLVEGSLAALHCPDLIFVLIDSDYRMAQTSQTRGRHAADIPKPEYGDTTGQEWGFG